MRVLFHNTFKKELKKHSPKIKRLWAEKLIKFLEHPFDQQLNNHELTGKYAGHRSINITGDIRAVYEPIGDIAFFVTIGNHPNLYK